MRNKRINIALITLLILGILIVGQASYRELLYGGVCANFTIIPTCYVALVYLILLLIFHIKKNGIVWFLILSGFGIVLAAYASVGHILGTSPCAISDIGIPTCFIGLTLFITILVLKFLELK